MHLLLQCLRQLEVKKVSGDACIQTFHTFARFVFDEAVRDLGGLSLVILLLIKMHYNIVLFTFIGNGTNVLISSHRIVLSIP